MKRTREPAGLLAEFNFQLGIAGLVVAGWLYVRPQFVGRSSPVSVLLEWVGLFGLGILLLVLPRITATRLGITAALISSICVFENVSTVGVMPSFPNYWMGLGNQVAMFSLVGVVLGLLAWSWIQRQSSRRKEVLERAVFITQRIVGSLIILWTLPSLLQPMDSILNIGDGTEKVLDEVAGWAVGNIPGASTSWVVGAFLGFPLLPLQLSSGSGNWKIVLIVLYINGLVLAVPVVMSVIARKCLPKLDRIFALAVSMIVVAVSGDPRNTSLFQELNFLARGVLPVALGLVTITVFGNYDANDRLRYPKLALIGLFAAVTALNNFEYGVPAALSTAVLCALVVPHDRLRFRKLAVASLSFAASLAAALSHSALVGGDWLRKRLGLWYDVGTGGIAGQTHNDGSPIPAFGVPSLYFTLAAVGVATGIRVLRAHSQNGPSIPAISSLFFGLWSLLSAPYFLNGGQAGAFRTQFLLIPIFLLVVSLTGLMLSDSAKNASVRSQIKSQPWWRYIDELRSIHFLKVPLALLGAVFVVAVTQTPNGLREWHRVQSPETAYQDLAEWQKLDEWSPERLDWINPEGVRQLAFQYGGAAKVGWWFSYGNAIELLTDIENLLGVTGWETMRSESQTRLGCEPILRSSKRYVISIDGAETKFAQCRGLVATPITSPNDDGLVVFSLRRS